MTLDGWRFGMFPPVAMRPYMRLTASAVNTCNTLAAPLTPLGASNRLREQKKLDEAVTFRSI